MKFEEDFMSYCDDIRKTKPHNKKEKKCGGYELARHDLWEMPFAARVEDEDNDTENENSQIDYSNGEEEDNSDDGSCAFYHRAHTEQV